MQKCRDYGRTYQGWGDLELPVAHTGPRARLLAGYGRSYLGISLEKTDDRFDPKLMTQRPRAIR